jgi:hypothetical protein
MKLKLVTRQFLLFPFNSRETSARSFTKVDLWRQLAVACEIVEDLVLFNRSTNRSAMFRGYEPWLLDHIGIMTSIRISDPEEADRFWYRAQSQWWKCVWVPFFREGLTFHRQKWFAAYLEAVPPWWNEGKLHMSHRGCLRRFDPDSYKGSAFESAMNPIELWFPNEHGIEPGSRPQLEIEVKDEAQEKTDS